MPLAAGVGENDRRLAPYRSRDTIFNRNGGESENPVLLKNTGGSKQPPVAPGVEWHLAQK